jgi:hypothetical protein
MRNAERIQAAVGQSPLNPKKRNLPAMTQSIDKTEIGFLRISVSPWFKLFSLLLILPALLALAGNAPAAPAAVDGAILRTDDFKHYVDYFNRMEDENIANAIPNAKAWDWMRENIPLFTCPQDNFEEIFYFRWWTLRKHIVETPQGYVFNEFLIKRSYADRYNMIACAIGHHVYEARWLRDRRYLDDYIRVWYRGNEGAPMPKLRGFSSWTADALYKRYLVDMNREELVSMLPDLDATYAGWEEDRLLPDGLFWQYDVRDGMEESISGGRRVKNARPTINSYMLGNARALSAIARLAGDDALAAKYDERAATLKRLIQENLWDLDAQFFKTRLENGQLSDAREAIGFVPWYFHIPDPGCSVAWKQLTDPDGFRAPFGVTTAERRHPRFRASGKIRTCEWDGAIWPFATAQTLTGLANLLIDYPPQDFVTTDDYFNAMERYVESTYYRGRPYIGEYQDETTGFWIMGDAERSRYYNHSTFNDLVISGLVGLRPRADDTVEVHPLIPEGKWDWFCLDRVAYHGTTLTIVWDKTGERFGHGAGLRILADGKEIAATPKLEPLTAPLR